MARCKEEAPRLVEIAPGNRVACHKGFVAARAEVMDADRFDLARSPGPRRQLSATPSREAAHDVRVVRAGDEARLST